MLFSGTRTTQPSAIWRGASPARLVYLGSQRVWPRVLTITGFTLIRGVAITPDGRFVYVTNSYAASNSVSVVDTSTNTIIETITGFSSPGNLAVSPDGRFVYVTNGGTSNSVSVVDTSTNTIIETITGFNGPRNAVVSPDGRFVYVMNFGNNTIASILA